MSDRLHIGRTDDPTVYDAVIDDLFDAKQKAARFAGMPGPLKITIGDARLFEEVDPILESAFRDRGHDYPRVVSSFWSGGRRIGTPTRSELDEWLY